MGLNHITIAGRLVREPELRYTASQVPVTSFTVAVDEDYTPEGKQKQTDFIDCAAWKSKAEAISKYFHKGSAIIVEGRLKIRSYTDTKGTKHYPAQISVEHFYFNETKKAAQEAAGSPQNASGDGETNPFTGEPIPYGETVPDYTDYTGDEDEGTLPY